jgi:hypothetical protein
LPSRRSLGRLRQKKMRPALGEAGRADPVGDGEGQGHDRVR